MANRIQVQMHDSEDPVTQTASRWLLRKDNGLTRLESAELKSWLAEDPYHKQEFERLEESWGRLDSLRFSTEAQAIGQAVLARAQRRKRHRRFFLAGFGAIAAAIVIGLLVHQRNRFSQTATPLALQSKAHTYKVIESQARPLTLSDGSLVELKGDSSIEVQFTPSERRVRLVKGEALFTVAKSPKRPFIVVVASAVTVKAVGTAFDIRFDPDSIDVAVTEGKIQLGGCASQAESGKSDGHALAAGQHALVSLATGRPELVTIEQFSKTKMEELIAWRSTLLHFEDTPLDEVISAFNRYNSHKLVLGTSDLRNRKLTGIIRANNLDGFLHLLEVGVEVKGSQTSSTETVLYPAR